MKRLKNGVRRLGEYLRKFAADESGTAITEYIIVLAIVAGLATVILVVRNTAAGKISQVNSAIEGIDINDYTGS